MECMFVLIISLEMFSSGSALCLRGAGCPLFAHSGLDETVVMLHVDIGPNQRMPLSNLAHMCGRE